MYQIGEHLHERYGDLINYNPRKIYVRSSGINRCLDSASSFLASFCPPKGYFDWNPNLKWQPIPINSMPREKDNVLYYSRHSEFFIRFCRPSFDDHQMEKVNCFERIVGIPYENKREFFLFLDGLVAEVDHDLPVIPELQKHVGDAFELMDQYFTDFVSCHSDIASCGSGFFEETVKNMKSFWENEKKQEVAQPSVNCFVYSASDIYVVALLGVLGVYPDKRMKFGATFVIELHEIEGKPQIRLLYNGDTVQNPTAFQAVTLKDCEEYCPMEKYESTGSAFLDQYLNKEK